MMRQKDSLEAVLKKPMHDTSLCQVYSRLAGLYAANDPGRAEQLIEKALSIVKAGTAEEGVVKRTMAGYKALLFEQKAELLEDQDNYYKAVAYYDSAIQISRGINDLPSVARIEHNLSFVYSTKGDYPEAARLLNEAARINGQTGNKKFLCRNYNALALVYSHIRNFANAENYFRKAQQLYSEMGSEEWVAKLERNLGNMYFDQALYEKALKSYQLSLEGCLKFGCDSFEIADCYESFGNTYRYMENFKQGLRYAEKAFGVRLRNKANEKIISRSYINIGSTLIDLNDYKKAIDYLLKGLEIKQRLGQRGSLLPCYGSLSEAYAGLGDYKNAFHYQKLFANLSDSIVNEESNEQINELAVKYETEKKDNELLKKESELKAKDALAKQKTTERNAFIGGFILMIILAFFIFRGFRQKQKTNEIITRQKHLVEEKQKEILDSINYAKRLQDAILPPTEDIKKHLPGSFVLYKPKDIVAGDFYWMDVTSRATLIAAGDCTGHGVPGALVSVVCSNALNRAVKEFGIAEPGPLLDKTRELVLETFSKSDADVKDGMDISLCAIEKSSEAGLYHVHWSGANNPLWYVQNGTLSEIKPNKQPIGRSENPQPFATHTLDLRTGDSLYMFTDGYADQFGGEKGKKFKYRQLQEIIAQYHALQPAEQEQQLDQAFESWRGRLEQIDDVLVIGIKLT